MATKQFLSIKTLPDRIEREHVKQLEQFSSADALFAAMLLSVLLDIRDGASEPAAKPKKRFFGNDPKG